MYRPRGDIMRDEMGYREKKVPQGGWKIITFRLNANPLWRGTCFVIVFSFCTGGGGLVCAHEKKKLYFCHSWNCACKSLS